MFVDLLVVIYIIGGPFLAFTELEQGPCFQIWTIIQVFCLTVPMIAAREIVKTLDNPFEHKISAGHESKSDTYNIDALMGSSEQCIFASLRVSFDAAAMEQEEPDETAAFSETPPPALEVKARLHVAP